MTEQHNQHGRAQIKLLTFPHSPASELETVQGLRKLIVTDPTSQSLLRELERLAPSDAAILICGETGTGKELVARYIHARSGRPGPFVAVNCGAFSEQLIEAELFGHEAGAFTGAQHARAGWFEAASGGTLLLDEIGDLPLAMQVKLLRVLQERQVVRLGSRRALPINVRVLAATNIDLETAAAAQSFRRDLYYRLSVAPIRLAPLRERPHDIMPLVHHFVALYGDALSRHGVVVSAAAERVLLAHPWPGNVRELENVIHTGLLKCNDGVLNLSDLTIPRASLGMHGAQAEAADPLTAIEAGIRRLLATNRAGIFETMERLLLGVAFEHCGRNQVWTAKRLGITRNIARAQLKRFGLIRHRRQPGYDVDPTPGGEGSAVTGGSRELNL
jgi:sigma-54-specific transcriptional regulator